MIYGYARVSTDGQSVEAQVAALKKHGAEKVFRAWADTTTPHGRLMLTVLGGLTEFECELIRARTDEGRSRAKARGVRLGRKPKLTDHQKREALERRARGDETHTKIGRSYNVSGWTIFEIGRTTLRPCQRPRLQKTFGVSLS